MIEASLIPKGSILTPNQKEYKMLFGDINIRDAAKKFDCTIVLKGPETIVASPENFIRVVGGNAGLTKGGTGDVQAGLTAALFAKNDAFLAAAAASYVVKKSADVLYKKFGTYYNSDDLVNKIPEVLAKMV
jgi:NAD(P)H-hydrate epimerase